MQFDMILLDSFWTNCWPAWLLASILPFLLGLFLGWWLWSKYKAMVGQKETEVASWHKKYNELEGEFSALKYKYGELEKDKNGLRASLNKCEADKMTLLARIEKANNEGGDAGMVVASGGTAGLAEGVQRPASLSTIFKPHDLQIVEGIGPKIEQLLKDAGIKDWKDLSESDEDTLNKILTDAGPRYRIHDPKTWAKQAELALKGKWDELIEYQKFLDTGRDDRGSQTPSKVEKLAEKKLGFSKNPEDLQIVEGVGPKIESILKAAGINTRAELGNTSVERLNEILAEAGERYRLADPTTWPKQATLAAEENWRALREYQEFLDGGKTPK
ncbi:MAG: helix-hairpin-helix domain-containing protein [Saprospiraceae bacterium]